MLPKLRTTCAAWPLPSPRKGQRDGTASARTTLGGYTVLPGAVNTTEYDIAKTLRIAWIGAKVAVRDDLDVAAAVYHYNQNNYITATCTNGGLSDSKCAGTLDAASAMIDYRVTKRLDMYAGVMWSRVAGARRAGLYLALHRTPTFRSEPAASQAGRITAPLDEVGSTIRQSAERAKERGG
jgi:hypothetical protein